MKVEWRWNRGWFEDELEGVLARARHGSNNFSVPAERMNPEHGWNHVHSEATIAQEPLGGPVAEGAFFRARRSLELLEFSDPRVVVGHFDEREPLLGRTVLLELRPIGLRFLCPVRIAAVLDEQDGYQTRFGFSFETLDGHVESGREWFTLTKNHDTGEVRFRIEAFWRAGQFPNWWSYLGFQLMGRRYQRAWHLLAHERLRALVRREEPAPAHGPVLTHSGHLIDTSPIHFRSLRGAQREDMRTDRLLRVGALGLVCGARAFTTPAVLAARWARSPSDTQDALAQLFSRPRTAAALAVCTLGEWAMDKLPVAPDRTAFMGLLGRIGGGALVGYLMAARGDRRRPGPALFGAAAAVVGTWLSFLGRRRLARSVGEPWAGIIEDAAALGASALLASRIR